MSNAKMMLLCLNHKRESIRKTEEQIEDVMNKLTSTTIRPKEVDVITSKADNFGINISRLIDKKIELKQKQDELKEYSKEMLLHIEKINNKYYADILIKKYLGGMSLSQIAEVKGKEYSNIRHAHGRALQTLDNILKKELTSVTPKV